MLPLKLPLHPAQRDVYTDQLIDQDRPNYNVIAYMKFKGSLDVPVFINAIQTQQSVFDIFRLRFDDHQQEPFCHIVEHVAPVKPGILDFSMHMHPESEAEKWMQERSNRPFVIERDQPLFEQFILKIAGAEHWYYFRFHHLIFDGYCWRIWVSNIAEEYNALLKGTNTNAAVPSYLDEMVKANDYYNSPLYEADGQYWKQKITRKPARLLQKRYPKVNAAGKESGAYIFKMNLQQRQMLEQLTQTANVKLPHLTIAAVIIYLAAITGRHELVFGTPAHKRKEPHLRQVLGMFTGIVPFVGTYQPDMLLIDFLTHIAASQREDARHMEYLIGDLAKHFRNNALEGPLLDMIVNYVLLDMDAAFSSGVTSSFHVLFSEFQVEPLRMIWWDYSKQDELLLRIDYRYEYFTEAEIVLLTQRLLFILEQFATALYQPLSNIGIIPPKERLLLKSFSGPEISYPSGKTVAELFTAQAVRTPSSTALVCGEIRFTYRELDEHTNRLAYYLRSLGVREETLVPVCLDRSADLLIAILGILKAGGAYLPVDPRYPAERIGHMLQDTGSGIAVSNHQFEELLGTASRIVNLDELSPLIQALPAGSVTINASCDSLAYVMYTSGSTGRPKGVMVTHRNITSLALGSGFVEWEMSDVLLSTGSPSFDATTIEYWGPLLNGAQLVLCPEERLLDVAGLKEEIGLRGVTKMWFTAGWLNQLVDTDITVFNGLRTVIAGGEKLSGRHIGILRQHYPSLEIINGYGPTENTTFSLTFKIDHVDNADNIPIGYPLGNRFVYILDQAAKLLPVGVEGELYVGGDGLSRGYLHQEELTAERFVTMTLDDGIPIRLYRTGDKGRWLPDGSALYLGRTDDQVKLRGYRIEPGEIEQVMMESGMVKQAAVQLQGEGGGKYLAGYIAPQEDFTEEALRNYLGSRLPDYMIPSLLVPLAAFPLTNNGKIDRAALPDLVAPLPSQQRYIAPRNIVEQQLALIWEESLGVPQVSVHDDFFRLGGDSIRAIGVISRLRKTFDERIRLYDLYQHTTIDELACFIRGLQPAEEQGNAAREAVIAEISALSHKVLSTLPGPGNITDVFPMSDIQSGMVYASLLQPDKNIYHDQIVYRIAPSLNVPLLEKALNMLVQQHGILRTVFNLDAHEEGLQVVYRLLPVKIRCLDLAHISQGAADTYIQRYLEQERSIPFEIGKDVMWRLAILQFSHGNVLVLQFHHAIMDGWSLATLTIGLNSLYRELQENPDRALLPPLQTTYKDFVVNGILEKKNKACQEFWKKELEGYKRLDIFTGEIINEQTIKAYDVAFFEKLHQRTEADHVSLKALFLGAYIYVLGMLTHETEVTLGVVANNRPLTDDGSRILGCFLNSVPFRVLKIDGPVTWKAYIKQLDQQLRELKQWEGLSFFEITKITGEHAGYAGHENPLFDVLFNFVNFHVYDHMKGGLFEQGHVAAGEADPLAGVHEVTNTYLDCCVSTTGNSLLVIYKMTRRLKSGKSLEDLLAYFDAVITNYLYHAEDLVNRKAVLPANEWQRMAAFNDTPVHYQGADTILSAFDRQVQRSPAAVAVVHGQRKLTYAELDGWSSRLASCLRSKGIKEDSLVPLCVNRTPEMIIAILAVLKAGAAYVPLDPGYPEERIAHILRNTDATLVLSSNACRGRLEQHTGIGIIELDRLPEMLAGHAPATTAVDLHSGSLAYVIYTSGSTGRPKGVMAEHGAVVNLVQNQGREYGINSHERILLFSNYCFDPSVEQIFFALLNGAVLVLLPEDAQRDAFLFEQFLELNAISHLEITPSFLDNITPRAYPGLKRVVCGGEPCRKQLAERWSGLVDFYNVYGPTETTISALAFHCRPDALSGLRALPVGRPLGNIRAHILDLHGNRQPAGVTGELVIGGAGVTRGYLRLPELTARQFVTGNGNDLSAGRWYRTGDLARWLPDGNIEYVGRIDNQLKIHGFRIEPDEIIQVLLQSGLARQAAVVPKARAGGEKQLVAYVVPAEGFDSNAIRAFLSASLPAYMVPGLFISVDTIPLTSNGKVDLEALPAPDTQEGTEKEYVAPRNDTELQLAHIWQQLLGLERVGIYDDFFQLGGHSLLAMRLSAHVRKELGVNVPVKRIFLCKCIAELSDYIKLVAAAAIVPGSHTAANIMEL